MSVTEAAELIGVSQEYIRSLIRKGKIKAQRVGPMWVVNAVSLLAFKKRREAKHA